MAPARVEETGAGRKRRLPSRGLVGANASATRTASTTLVRVVRVHVEPVGGGGGDLLVRDDGCFPVCVCVCACVCMGDLLNPRANWHVRDGETAVACSLLG
jgi:hypothetical protein